MQPQQETVSEYYWEIQQLRMRIGRASEDARALRDLGVIYLRTGHLEEAHGILTRATAYDRLDPRLWFYQGLSQELIDSTEAALRTYERYRYLSASSIYTRAMRGRSVWLREEAMRRALTAALARASQPSPDSVSSGTYAVFPLHCEGTPAEFAALGKGLRDLISQDLTQVRGAEIVEPDRVRTALALASSLHSGTDDERVSHVGRALGAGRLITGRCSVDRDRRVAVNLVLHDTVEQQTFTVSSEARLENVFSLEEELFGRLLEQLGLFLPTRARRGRVPATGLEALAAYSRGLEQEEAGQPEQAAASYRQAVALYPGFTLAVVRRDAAADKLLAPGSTKEELLNLIVQLESSTTTSALLDARLLHMESSIGSGFVPGQDNRKLPSGNVGELPEPPRPTGNE